MLSGEMDYLQDNIGALSDLIITATDTNKSGKIFRIHRYDRWLTEDKMNKIGIIEIAKAIIRDYKEQHGCYPNLSLENKVKVYRRTWCATRKTFDADVSWEFDYEED